MRPLRRLAAAALLVVTLTSCGGSDGELRVGGGSAADQPDEEASSEPVTPQPIETTPPPEQSESADPLADLSSVSEVLPVTGTAVVAVETPTGGRGVVELTVTEVRPATTEELGRPDAEGSSTLLVSFTVRARVGAAELVDWQPGGTLQGRSADGRYAGVVGVAGNDACPLLVVPPTWTDGETLPGCTLTPSSPDLRVAAIAYVGPPDVYGRSTPTWVVDQ